MNTVPGYGAAWRLHTTCLVAECHHRVAGRCNTPTHHKNEKEELDTSTNSILIEDNSTADLLRIADLELVFTVPMGVADSFLSASVIVPDCCPYPAFSLVDLAIRIRSYEFVLNRHILVMAEEEMIGLYVLDHQMPR
jgi:hypothetical protein